jgi:hypothetical protein
LNDNQVINKNIWMSLNGLNHSVIVRKVLTNEQSIEYEVIKNLSKQLITDNYNKSPTFKSISKTKIGYSIYRQCLIGNKKVCHWKISIDINTNKVIISCNKHCSHI